MCLIVSAEAAITKPKQEIRMRNIHFINNDLAVFKGWEQTLRKNGKTGDQACALAVAPIAKPDIVLSKFAVYMTTNGDPVLLCTLDKDGSIVYLTGETGEGHKPNWELILEEFDLPSNSDMEDVEIRVAAALDMAGLSDFFEG